MAGDVSADVMEDEEQIATLYANIEHVGRLPRRSAPETRNNLAQHGARRSRAECCVKRPKSLSPLRDASFLRKPCRDGGSCAPEGHHCPQQKKGRLATALNISCCSLILQAQSAKPARGPRRLSFLRLGCLAARSEAVRQSSLRSGS